MRQEMETMDVVALATLVKVSETPTDSLGTFRIETIVKGDLYTKVGATVEATYFGPPESKKVFLIQGVDPKSFVWSAPNRSNRGRKGVLGQTVNTAESPSIDSHFTKIISSILTFCCRAMLTTSLHKRHTMRS